MLYLCAYLSTSDVSPNTTLAALLALNIPPLADPTSTPDSWLSCLITSCTSMLEGAVGGADAGTWTYDASMSRSSPISSWLYVSGGLAEGRVRLRLCCTAGLVPPVLKWQCSSWETYAQHLLRRNRWQGYTFILQSQHSKKTK